MNFRHTRAAVFGIWGLVALFAVIEAIAWTIAGGVPRRPLVLVEVFAAWIVMLILAAVSTRRIGGLARTLSPTISAPPITAAPAATPSSTARCVRQ